MYLPEWQMIMFLYIAIQTHGLVRDIQLQSAAAALFWERLCHFQ